MARTVDLGWAVARCDSTELELMQPESEDSPASSFTVAGWESILALRDLINEVESDLAVAADAANNFPPAG